MGQIPWDEIACELGDATSIVLMSIVLVVVKWVARIERHQSSYNTPHQQREGHRSRVGGHQEQAGQSQEVAG